MMDFLHDTLSDTFEVGCKGSLDDLKWYCPDVGVIVFEPEVSCDTSILISTGIHGNETAPVEIVNQLVSDLFQQKLMLKSRVMVLLGNVAALKQGVRYLDFDMNRLFGASRKDSDSQEVSRAHTIEQLSSEFFNQCPDHRRIHLDLHTAIRSSNHERFGLLPFVETGKYPKWWVEFLQSVGLDALVINHAPSTTYSYFTQKYCAADSVTLELGKALPFGENDLTKFQGIKEGLYALVSDTAVPESGRQSRAIKIYKVSQVLIKHTEQFKLNFADDVSNFTGFTHGQVLATDRETEYRVEQPKEYVLFPNNNVKVGLRGGLMVVEDNLDAYLLDV